MKGGARIRFVGTIQAVVLFGFLLLSGSKSFAQNDEPYWIRANSNLVLVHAEVLDENRYYSGYDSSKRRACLWNEDLRFKHLPVGQPFIPKNCDDTSVYGLTASDFHVFEDGVEQKIESVKPERVKELTVRDNSGGHDEWSHTPRGVWSTFNWDSEWAPVTSFSFYRLAYIPAHPEIGKCHQIKITVNRKHSLVFFRDQYCSVQPPPAYPLEGTDLGKKIQLQLDSDKTPTLHLSATAAYFYTDANKALVDIAMEFSRYELDYQFDMHHCLHATIGVSGLVYKDDRTVVAKFSDSAFGLGDPMCMDVLNGNTLDIIPIHHGAVTPSATFYELASYGNLAGWCNGSGKGSLYANPLRCCDNSAEAASSGSLAQWCNRAAERALPTRYETQIQVAPGHYYLRVAITDGKNFGRAVIPLNIAPFDGKQLALSSIAFYRNFRSAHVAAKEAAAAELATDYVPLVSDDVQVTPTADTAFPRNKLVPIYFEINDPQKSRRTKVRARIRIVNEKTGAIDDFPEFDAAEYLRTGTTAFAVTKLLEVKHLPKGDYLVEAQATDSAGNKTPWQSTSITLK